MLSNIDRIIFLKGIQFFEQSAIHQLMSIAAACTAATYAQGATIIALGDVPHELFMVVTGQVQITQSVGQTGTVTHTLEPRSYFAEYYVFDDVPAEFAATATQDTVILKLDFHDLFKIMKTDLQLSYNYIRILSQHIKSNNEQIAQLSKQHARDMHRIFDKLDNL